MRKQFTYKDADSECLQEGPPRRPWARKQESAYTARSGGGDSELLWNLHY